MDSSFDATEGCHGLTNLAEPVTTSQVPADVPVPGGGDLEVGVYERVEHVIYTGADGASGPIGSPVRETISLGDEGMYQQVLSDAIGEDRLGGVYATSDTAFTLNVNCGAVGGTPYFGYTASAGQVVLLGRVGGTSFGTTYRRRSETRRE